MFAVIVNDKASINAAIELSDTRDHIIVTWTSIRL